MEILFNRVFTGKIESVRQHYVDAFGNREYEIFFRNGKKMFYSRSNKQSMTVVPGNIIRFTAKKVEPIGYWVITDILDSYTPDNIRELHYMEEQKQVHN